MTTPVSGILALCEGHATASDGTRPVMAWKNSRFLGPIELSVQRAGTTGGGTVYGVNFLGIGNANRQDFVGDDAAEDYQTTIAYAALSNNNWVVRIRGPSNGNGTVTIVAGSAAVTGSSTQFTTELSVGDEIVINGERRTVIAIASTTALTVDRAFGTAAAGVDCALVDGILHTTDRFTVSNVGGYAKITLDVDDMAPVGTILEVHFVTPVALFTYATATTVTAKREVQGYDLLWYVSGSTTAPSATAIYARPLGE